MLDSLRIMWRCLSTWRLLAVGPSRPGSKAPDLVFHSPVHNQTGMLNQKILLETDQLDTDYTLLLFYQGECQLCEDALIDLANKYQWLSDRNVRVIAISADDTKQAFEKKLPYHQWPDNYCDLTGMGGVNFKNYTVLGVPTLYLLDQEGIVLKKTAMVEELLEAVKTR